MYYLLYFYIFPNSSRKLNCRAFSGFYRKNFVWENCFYDYNEGREVWFGDIEDKNKPKYHYYLFYDINGTKTFHSPIQEEDIKKYDLEVINIDQLETEGHDISDLISNQFVQKVLVLIDSKNYKLVMSDEAKIKEKQSV